MGGGDSAIAAEWVDQVMALAYEGFFFPFQMTFEMTLHCFIGVKRNKKLKVLVNPHSGQVSSRMVFPHQIFEPNVGKITINFQ
jgi:hypothetical protein